MRNRLFALNNRLRRVDNISFTWARRAQRVGLSQLRISKRTNSTRDGTLLIIVMLVGSQEVTQTNVMLVGSQEITLSFICPLTVVAVMIVTTAQNM